MGFGDLVGEDSIVGGDVVGVEHWYIPLSFCLSAACGMSMTSILTERERYFISTIEALLPETYHGCAIIGDSITDGRGSDTNENNRYPLLPL